MTELLSQLRDLERGERIRIQTADGDTYTMYVADPADYEPPDEYGGGNCTLRIELDTDVHDVPGTLSTESGEISMSNDYSGTWEEPTLVIWDPVVENEEIVKDEWKTLGTVKEITVLE